MFNIGALMLEENPTNLLNVLQTFIFLLDYY
jgi:hypothetical protein